MMRIVTQPFSKRRQSRQTLLASCGAAIAVSLALQPTGVAAQSITAPPPPPTGAFQGTISNLNVLTPGGTVNVNRGSIADIITIGSTTGVSSVNAIINWTPTEVTGSGPINFLPFGTTARFVSTGQVSDFTILNRIIPADGNRGIRLDGTITSRINSDVPGGNVWFYSPGGIIAGARSVFDVGGLVLTANNIDTTGGLFGNPASSTIRFRGVSDSQSEVMIESGAQIRANNYVALVAPRVVQAGTVTVDGSVGYIAADQVDVRIQNGLFDIEFLEGTGARSSPIEHTGTTTGPSDDGVGGRQRIYLAAYPKNDAITVLVGGTLGYQPATTAFVENGRIVLSAGRSVFDAGISMGDPGVSATPANISIGADLSGDVTFTSSLTATAISDIIVTPQSNSRINFDGSLDLSAGRRIEIGADDSEAIIIGGSLNASNRGSAANSGIFLNANGTGTVSVPRGLITIGGSAFLRSTRDSHAALIRTRIDGGQIIVGGNTVFDASDFANFGGGDGVAGSATLQLLSAGSLFETNSLQLFASARSQQGVDGLGNPTGGTGSAGNAEVTINNGTFNATEVILQTDSFNAQGNNGTGGRSLFEVTGGTATLGSLQLLASAGIGGEGGGAATVEGDLKGGTSTLSVTGGSLNITGDLRLEANANSLGQFGPAGDTIGGAAGFTVSTGASLTVGGTVIASSSGLGSSVDGRSVTDAAIGGQIDLLANGGIVIVGALDLEAIGLGSDALSRGGDARGGTINIRATGGGVLAVNSISSVTSRAQGGSGLTGGNATGGNVSLLANGGTLDLAGDATLIATGSGGSALESQFFLTGAGVRSGSGTGGTINIQSGILNGTGSIFTFTKLTANAGGNSAIFTNNGIPLAGASGGSGTGGSIMLNVNSGLFSGDELAFSASGEGGNGAAETTAASTGSGGAGLGGGITASFVGGTGTIGRIGLTSAGSGGQGGRGASDAGYGSIDAAGVGGSGTGGTIALTLGSSAVTINAIELIAGGRGSIGGGSATQVGGRGGAGTAGSARVLFIQDPTIPTITINTDTIGGAGGNGVTGGAGGDAINTTVAALDVSVGALTTFNATTSANATGGAGGIGSSGIGGVGGNASAGTARVTSNGATANLSASTLNVTANALGGLGGNGARGGTATGGIAIIDGTGGTLSSGRIRASAIGTGGAGGAGGTNAASRGGAGNSGTGGGALVTNVSVVNGSDTFISIDTTGFGGLGGNGRTGGNGGDGFGGSGLTGGSFLTLNNGGTAAFDSGFNILSDGRGGSGGGATVSSSFGQPGGDGGNGTAGNAGIGLSGGTTELRTSGLTLSASGFGADGGANFPTPGLIAAPSGGSATGGAVSITTSGGARLLTSDDVTIAADAFGASGGVGPSNSNTNGGNGGSAIAGTVLIDAANGGFVASGSSNVITANASGGRGGDGGGAIINGVNIILGTGGNGGNATAGRVETNMQIDNANGSLTLGARAIGGLGGPSDNARGNAGSAVARAGSGGVFATFDSGTNATSNVEINAAAITFDGQNSGNAIAGNSSLTVSGVGTTLTAPLITLLSFASSGVEINSRSAGLVGSARGGNVTLTVAGASAALTSTTVTLDAAATSGNGRSGGSGSAGNVSVTIDESTASIGELVSAVAARGGSANNSLPTIGAPGSAGSGRSGNFTYLQNGGRFANGGSGLVGLTFLANATGGAGGAGGNTFSGTVGGNATAGVLSVTINGGPQGTPATFLSSLSLASTARGGTGGNSLDGTAASGNGGNAFGGGALLSLSGQATDVTISGLNLATTALGGNGGSGETGGSGGNATQGRIGITVLDQATLRLEQSQLIATTTTGGNGGSAANQGSGGRGGNASAGNAEQGVSILVSGATLIADSLNISAKGTGGAGGAGGSSADGALSSGAGSDGANGQDGDGSGANGSNGESGGNGGSGGSGTNGGAGGSGGIGEGGSIRIEINDAGGSFSGAAFTSQNLSLLAQGIGGRGGNGANGGNGQIGARGGDGGIGGDGDLGAGGQDLGYGSFTAGGPGGMGGNGGNGGNGGSGGDGGNGGSSGAGGEARGGTVSLIVDSGTATTGLITADVLGSGGFGGSVGSTGLGATGGIGGRGGGAGFGAAGGFGMPIGARGSDGLPGERGVDGAPGADGIDGVNSFGLASVGYGGVIVVTTGDGAGSNGTLSASDVNLTANGQGEVFNGLPTNGTIEIKNQNDGASPSAISFNSLSATANSNSTGFNVAGITIETGAGGIEIADSVSLNTTANVSITATDLGRLNVVNSIDVNTSGGKIDIRHFGTTGVAVSSGRGSYTAWGNINVGIGRVPGAETILRASDRLSLLTFNGSINADILQGVGEVSILANRDAFVGTATVTGPPAPFGSLMGGLIDLRAGYDLFSGSYNPSSVFVFGDFTATGSIQIRSGGDVFIEGSAALRSDNFISLQSGGDVIVADGARLASALNLAPDLGYGTFGDIDALAGSITPSFPIPGDISSFVAGEAIFTAAGNAINLSGEAIQATDATFTSRDFLATINNAPALGAPRSDDGGVLTAPCLEGNICIGTITATRNVNLGPATGLVGLPNQVFTFGEVTGTNVSIRANDTIELSASNSLTSLLATNNLFVASLGGDINLIDDVEVTGGAGNISFYANGSITGVAASIGAPGDLGLYAGTGINVGSISTNGVINTIDSDGGIDVAGALDLAAPITIGFLSVSGGDVDVRSGNINIGTASTPNNVLLSGGSVFLGQTGGIFATPVDIIATGSSVTVDDIAAAGNISLTGDNLVSVLTGAVADGALTLTSSLGGISAATLTGSSVTLDSAMTITAGNVTATDGDISIAAVGAISTGDLTASLGSVALSNQMGSITAGLITARNDFSITTGSNLNFGGVSVGDDIRITTTGSATLGRLTTTGAGTDNEDDSSNIFLSAGGALSVIHANSDNDFTATAARFETGLNTIITAGDISINTVGDALLGNSQAGGFISVTAGGLVDYNSLTSGSFTEIDAVGAVTGGTAQSGGSLLIDGASINVGNANARFGLRFNSGGSIVAGNVSGPSMVEISGATGVALRNVTSTNGEIALLSSLGGVSFGDVNAARSLNVIALLGDIRQTGVATVARSAFFNGGTVRIASITVGDDLNITSAGLVDLTSATTLRTPIDTGYGSMSDDSNILINAAGAITTGTLRAVDNLTITGTSLGATSLTATSLTAGQSLLAAINGNSNIGNANGGSLVQVTTFGGNRVGTATSARGDVILRGTPSIIELGDAFAGRDIILSALPGTVTHTGIANAARSVGITGNNVSLGNVIAGNDIDITSFSPVTAASLTTTGTAPMLGAGSDIIVNVMLGINPVTITNANAFSALRITNTGNANLGTLRAGTSLTVTGRSINAGTSTAGTSLALTSTSGDIVAANVTGGNVTLNSAQALTAGNIIATASDISLTAVTGIDTGDITASLGSVSISNGFGLIETGVITARNDFSLVTGSNIDFGGVSVGDDIRITTTGSATLGRLTTTGLGTDNESDASNIVLSANGALSVVHADSDNDFTATAARFETGLNTIITGGDITINSSGDALLGNSQAGGFISVNADGLIGFNSISSGGNTSLFTSGSVTGASSTSGANTLVSARNISIGTVTSDDVVEYRSFGGGVINVGVSTAAGDVLVNGQGAVTLGTVTANGAAGPNSFSNGGNIFVVTTGTADIGTANARGMIGVSANAVTGTGTWTAGEDIYVGAATTATVTNLSAGDDLDILAPGGISLTNGVARGDARDDRSLQIFGSSVGNLFLTVESPNDGADIRLSSSNAVNATNLTAADDIIATTAGAVSITGLASTRGVGVIGMGSDIDINAGSATIAAATAFDGLRVNTTGNAALGTSQAGDSITVDSGGAASFAALTSGTSTQIDAVGAVTGGNAQAGSTLIISSDSSVNAGNVSGPSFVQITGATGVTLGNIASSNGNVNLDSATGGISFVDANVGRNLNVIAPLGDIRQTGVATVTRDALFNGGTVRIASITVGDDLNITSAGLVDLASATTLRTPIDTGYGSMSDDSNILINAAGAITTGTLRAVDNITVTGSALNATSLTAGQTLLATIANGSVIGTASGGSLVQVNAGGSNRVSTATSARGDVILTSTNSNIDLGDATAGRDISLTARNGALTQTGTATATRDVLVSANSIALGTVSSGARIVTNSNAGTSFTTLTSGTSAQIDSVGALTGGAISAGSSLAFTAQSTDVGLLSAGTTITGTTTGLARMTGAAAGGAFTLNAGQTNLGIVNAGTIAVTSGQGVIFNQLVSRGTTSLSAGDDIAGTLINSSGALIATAGRNINVPTIIAASVAAQAGGTATIATLTSTGAASVSATGGIAIASTSIGSGLTLAASSGAVIVSNDARAVGSVNATGRDVSLTALGALDVASATATSGNIVLASGGNLNLTTGQSSGAIRLTSSNGDVSGGTLTASGGDIVLSGRNATLSGVNDASGAIMITTPGLATLSSRALASTIDVRSGNIAIGATAQIGAQGRTAAANFANTGNSVTTIGGAGVQTGYSISNAELGRVFAGDIVITAPRVNQSLSTTGQVSTALNSRAPDVILDTLTLSGANNITGATAGNIGTSGRFAIISTGKLRTVGAVTVNNLTSANRFVVNASETIEVDAATGLISLRNATGGLGGTLLLTSSDVIAASLGAIGDVITAADIGTINDRLARNDGATVDDGYLRADTITVTVGNAFYVQNSGANSSNLRSFSDRRGVSVGAGGLNINVTGSTSRIVINGRQVDSAGGFIQGVDFLRGVKINGGTVALGTVQRGLFDFGSTINGCAILNVAACQVSFDNGNIARDVIQEAVLQEGKSKLPDALFEVKEAAEIDFQPLIDDPVTGAGNDDNWAIDDKAVCAPGDESCATPQ